MRFLALLAGVFVLVAMIYFMILFWGMGRPVTIFSNEILDKPTPWIIRPWDVELDLGPNAFEWADVVRDASGVLRLVPSELREQNETELAKSSALKKTLREHTKEAKTCCLVVNIISNVADIDTQVSAEIPKEWDGRVLIQSEYEPVLTQLHIQRPLFAFGTSAADRVRFLTYQSLRLLPAVNFTRDVYVTPLKMSGRTVLSDKIVEEVHRRKRRVVVGPLRTENETREAKLFSPDGYFILSSEAARPLQD